MATTNTQGENESDLTLILTIIIFKAIDITVIRGKGNVTWYLLTWLLSCRFSQSNKYNHRITKTRSDLNFNSNTKTKSSVTTGKTNYIYSLFCG